MYTTSSSCACDAQMHLYLISIFQCTYTECPIYCSGGKGHPMESSSMHGRPHCTFISGWFGHSNFDQFKSGNNDGLTQLEQRPGAVICVSAVYITQTLYIFRETTATFGWYGYQSETPLTLYAIPLKFVVELFQVWNEFWLFSTSLALCFWSLPMVKTERDL